MIKIFKIILIFFCCILGGCVSHSGFEPVYTQNSTDPLKELSNVAKATEINMRHLSRVNISSKLDTKQKKHLFEYHEIPKGFEQTTTLSYIGEAELAGKSIASLAGYDYKVIGKRPEIALLVHLEFENETLNDIMLSFLAQLGTKADYDIDIRQSIITLRYL